jgi:hypothetical protein
MSSINTTVCYLWALFSRTFLKLQSSASVVLHPALEPWWFQYYQPCMSPYVERSRLIPSFPSLAIVGTKAIRQSDFTLVRSGFPDLRITTTLANFCSTGSPVSMNVLIRSQKQELFIYLFNLVYCLSAMLDS